MIAGDPRDPLMGALIRLPDGVTAKVLDIEHEYDDGATLRYVDGPHAGSLTMRDTYALRRYEVVAPSAPQHASGDSRKRQQ